MKIIKLLVKTNMPKTEITEADDVIKMNVKTSPEEGKANFEIIKFLARKYKQPIKIISGSTSKKKLVRIG